MIALVFGVTFSLCGLFALGLAWKLLAPKRQMATWPQARGRIASIHVETRDHTFKDNRGFYYMAKVPLRVVKYRYDVGGFEHEGELYEGTTRGAHNARVESAYRTGQEVQVQYDPSNPKTGFLEPPRTTGAVVMGVLGATFLVIGIAAAVVGIAL